MTSYETNSASSNRNLCLVLDYLVVISPVASGYDTRSLGQTTTIHHQRSSGWWCSLILLFIPGREIPRIRIFCGDDDGGGLLDSRSLLLLAQSFDAILFRNDNSHNPKLSSRSFSTKSSTNTNLPATPTVSPIIGWAPSSSGQAFHRTPFLVPSV